MKANTGTVDRVVRLLLGSSILGSGVAQGQWWAAIGLLPVITAVLGWCPAYLPFGFSTCATRPKRG
jgi:hypothetical protein